MRDSTVIRTSVESMQRFVFKKACRIRYTITAEWTRKLKIFCAKTANKFRVNNDLQYATNNSDSSINRLPQQQQQQQHS